MQERATDVCAVKPAKGQGMDAMEWEPVGEQSFKEICIRSSLSGDKEAYLLVVDESGTVSGAGRQVNRRKACEETRETRPVQGCGNRVRVPARAETYQRSAVPRQTPPSA